MYPIFLLPVPLHTPRHSSKKANPEEGNTSDLHQTQFPTRKTTTLPPRDTSASAAAPAAEGPVVRSTALNGANAAVYAVDRKTCRCTQNAVIGGLPDLKNAMPSIYGSTAPSQPPHQKLPSPRRRHRNADHSASPVTVRRRSSEYKIQSPFVFCSCKFFYYRFV
ncbi:hypothetical protein Salat_2436200 [Sesamum alatum]|uniref:Uncharacterized protein n=1 Tax=Sesamum alatum TaxID=300844 RepID=A0AAE1XYF9_9LAMI|nr:hypothetical protein Salat_2436200 [Sesamum alatum]